MHHVRDFPVHFFGKPKRGFSGAYVLLADSHKCARKEAAAAIAVGLARYSVMCTRTWIWDVVTVEGTKLGKYPLLNIRSPQVVRGNTSDTVDPRELLELEPIRLPGDEFANKFRVREVGGCLPLVNKKSSEYLGQPAMTHGRPHTFSQTQSVNMHTQ